jgi:hypothetical protein
LIVGCVLVFAAGVAVADSRTTWKDAEAAARAHLVAQGADIVDVSPRKNLGTSFWIRTKKPDGSMAGQLVAVRGADVYATRSDKTIGDILRHDKLLTRRGMKAADLVTLVRELGELPPALGNIITGHRIATLNPKLTYGKGKATLVLHAPRAKEIAGAPNTPKLYLTRATLTISGDYALAWTVESVDPPAR